MSVLPISVAHLQALVPSPPVEWHETADALRWLAEVDFCERQSDSWNGRGWDNVAESFSSRAADAEMELEQLRYDAIEAIANATGAVRASEQWDDAYLAADEDLLTVKAAMQRARRDHAGDALFEREDAA